MNRRLTSWQPDSVESMPAEESGSVPPVATRVLQAGVFGLSGFVGGYAALFGFATVWGGANESARTGLIGLGGLVLLASLTGVVRSVAGDGIRAPATIAVICLPILAVLAWLA